MTTDPERAIDGSDIDSSIEEDDVQRGGKSLNQRQNILAALQNRMNLFNPEVYCFNLFIYTI